MSEAKAFGYSTLGKLHIDPMMVLGYLTVRLKSLVGFKLFFSPSLHLPIRMLDARGVKNKLRNNNVNRKIFSFFIYYQLKGHGESGY